MGWWFKERVGGHWEKETAVGVLVKYKTAYVKVRELTFVLVNFIGARVSDFYGV